MLRTQERGLGAGPVLFAVLFAAQASILVLSPILPQMAQEFGVTTSAIAQLRSVSGITAGCVALVFAVTGNRFRLTWLLYGGLGLLALASVISAWAPNVGVLVGTHVVMGVGLAAVLSAGMAASETWADDGDGRRVLSLALIGAPVAWVVGQPIVGWVAANDWRWAWIAVPFASAVLAGIAVVARSRSIPDAGQDCDPLGLWRLQGIKPWLLSDLIAATAWGGALVYAGAVFIDAYDVAVSATGMILGTGAVFYLPGNYLGRRLLESGNRILLVGFAITAGAAVVIFGSGQFPLAVGVAGFAVAAFFAAGRVIGGISTGLRLADGRRLAAMSLGTAAGQFGYLLGSAIGGVLLTNWGFSAMAWGFGFLYLLSAAIHMPRKTSARHNRRIRSVRGR